MVEATCARPKTSFGQFLIFLDRLLMKIESLVFGLAACVLIVVMCIVAADALGRYLFNEPLFFTVDLVSHYLLPVIMLMSAGVVLRHSRHISVDLFASHMPPRVYLALSGLALAVSVPVFWIMAHSVGVTSVESFEQGKVAMGIIPWPFWIEEAIYAVCMGLVTLRLAHMAVANLAAAVTGDTSMAITTLQSHDSPEEEAL